MKINKLTWVSFFVLLSTFGISQKTLAHQLEENPNDTVSSLESRLAKIAASLKDKEAQLPESFNHEETQELALGWLKGGRRSFVNTDRGGFLNRRGWRDRGGFWNYR